MSEQPMGSKSREFENAKCPVCKCPEGAFHEDGCDMERCPFCGVQLFSCECCYRVLGIDVSPGTWAYENGLTPEQEMEWNRALILKGRVPYLHFPLVCCRCGTLWPEWAPMVPDEEWQRVVPRLYWRGLLCADCWAHISQLVDTAERRSEHERAKLEIK